MTIMTDTCMPNFTTIDDNYDMAHAYRHLNSISHLCLSSVRTRERPKHARMESSQEKIIRREDCSSLWIALLIRRTSKDCCAYEGRGAPVDGRRFPWRDEGFSVVGMTHSGGMWVFFKRSGLPLWVEVCSMKWIEPLWREEVSMKGRRL